MLVQCPPATDHSNGGTSVHLHEVLVLYLNIGLQWPCLWIVERVECVLLTLGEGIHLHSVNWLTPALLTCSGTGRLGLASACPPDVALLPTCVEFRISEAALRRVMAPSTTVTRVPCPVLLGLWCLTQFMHWDHVVCTCLLEIPGISFYQLHGLGDLHCSIKSRIPFSKEALLNPSLSQATHEMVTQHVIQGLTILTELR